MSAKVSKYGVMFLIEIDDAKPPQCPSCSGAIELVNQSEFNNHWYCDACVRVYREVLLEVD